MSEHYPGQEPSTAFDQFSLPEEPSGGMRELPTQLDQLVDEMTARLTGGVSDPYLVNLMRSAVKEDVLSRTGVPNDPSNDTDPK